MSTCVSTGLSWKILKNLEIHWYSYYDFFTLELLLSLLALNLIQNWYTGTSNHGKCFSMFFNFLRFFWNPIIFFGFHRLQDSKNRISWIREQLKNFEKIIFKFSIRKSFYKPSFRFCQGPLVFPQDFHEEYWKTLKYVDIRISWIVLRNSWKYQKWILRAPETSLTKF